MSRPACTIRARALHLEPGDDAQQRRLAAARGPEEADELARAHGEAHVLQGDEAPELLADVLEDEEVGRGADKGGPRQMERAGRRAERLRPARVLQANGHFFGSDFVS